MNYSNVFQLSAHQNQMEAFKKYPGLRPILRDLELIVVGVLGI